MPEDTASLSPEIQAMAQSVRDLAQANDGDVESLLSLLRLLEQLHREIEDGPFRRALPTNRQGLYRLLQDMERAGGWPYIPRLRLRSIMHWIEELEDPEDDLLEEV